jgi:hypothetical protein
MKFILPGLATSMALRGLDVDALAEASRAGGKPVSADTVRKALAGHPVSIVSATRIASVLSSNPPIPGMADLIGARDPVGAG